MSIVHAFIMQLTLLILIILKFGIFDFALIGICMVKQIVCLVIDEAHRASGNYAYCIAIREACFKYCTHLCSCFLSAFSSIMNPFDS